MVPIKSTSTSYITRVQDHLTGSAEAKRRVATDMAADIIKAAHLIAAAFESGNKLLLCGNGGSAADCQHMAAEFVCRLSANFERSALAAQALTTNASFLTAFTNDFNFEDVFKRQIEALGKQGDVLLGITTSGTSQNILNAFAAARQENMKCIALVGDNLEAVELSDVILSVPSSNTQFIQEAHLAIEHILCDLVECILFDKK